MALESLVAAAFAAGTLEGSSILSSNRDKISSDELNDYTRNPSSVISTDPNSALGLFMPSLLYGTIALPMSILGASPGPAIVNYLLDTKGKSIIDNISDDGVDRRANLHSSSSKHTKRTLVPGKLPRIKHPSGSIAYNLSDNSESTYDRSNFTHQSTHNSNSITKNASLSVTTSNSLPKQNKNKVSPLNEITYSPSAIKRFKNDKKLAIQAMKEAKTEESRNERDSINSSSSKSKNTDSNTNKKSITNEMATPPSSKVSKSLRKTSPQDTNGSETSHPPSKFTHDSNAYLRPQFQNLYHLTSFPIYVPNLHSTINQNSNLNSSRYSMPRFMNTTYCNTPPFAEMMRRVRFLLVGTAVVGGILSHYSQPNRINILDVKKQTDNISSTKNQDYHSHEFFNDWKKRNVALRFISEHDYKHSHNNTHNQVDASRSFQTIKILISTNTTTDVSSSSNDLLPTTKVLRLDPTIPRQWHNLPIPPLERNQETEEKIPFLVCEADISIPVSVHLQNKNKNILNQSQSAVEKEHQTLSLEAVKLSTRILENNAILNHEDTSFKKASTKNNGSDVDDQKNSTRIINVVIKSGSNPLSLQNGHNYIVIDSLAVVGLAVRKKMETIHKQLFPSSQLKKVDTSSTHESSKNDFDSSNSSIIHHHGSSSSIPSDERSHTFSLFATIGSSIRNGCMKLFSTSFFQPNKAIEKKIIYLLTNQDMYAWLKPLLKDQGWEIVFYDLKQERASCGDQYNMIEKIPSNAHVFICGRDDITTIEQTCDFVSQLTNISEYSGSPESSLSSSFSQTQLIPLLERESSEEMLQILLQDQLSHRQGSTSKVAVHSTCIKSIHNEIFNSIRELLLSGKTIHEIQELINDTLQR